MATNILQALSPGLDIDLSTMKVELMDVDLPPLAVDQVTEAGEFPAKSEPVNDALQSNYSSLNPQDTRDLVVLNGTINDENSPLALGFRKAGDLVDVAPSSAILKVVEFVGEKALSLNDGTLVLMSDIEGFRYRAMLDLTSKKLKSLVAGGAKAKTAFMDAKCVVKLVFPVALVGATVAASSDTWAMVHNQSTAKDVTIGLPNHANGATVSYTVQSLVNIPDSDFPYRYAQIDTVIDVVRSGAGVFTSATITGATTDTGEVFPVVVGNQRNHSDYKHDLSLAVVTNGSAGIILKHTIATEDYTNARKITMPWSSGVTVDTAGKLSASQKLDIWYNGVAGATTWMTAGSTPWSSNGKLEQDFATPTAVFSSGDVEFKVFSLADQMDLILRPADLSNNYSADFDKFAIKLQETVGSNYTPVNHNGGTYQGCFISSLVSEPAAAGYDSVTVKKTTQPFIMRLFLGLD